MRLPFTHRSTCIGIPATTFFPALFPSPLAPRYAPAPVVVQECDDGSAGGAYSVYGNGQRQFFDVDFGLVAFPGSLVCWPSMAPHWWEASQSSPGLPVPVKMSFQIQDGIVIGRDGTQIWTGLKKDDPVLLVRQWHLENLTLAVPQHTVAGVGEHGGVDKSGSY